MAGGLGLALRLFASFLHRWELIVVRRDLTRRWKRWYMAHCLGHHFLHAGNQLWLRKKDEWWWRRQEREADEFAAYLLMPEEELRKLKVHVKFIVSELQNKDC